MEMGRNRMSSDRIRRLFMEFTRLRQKGCTRDEAWARIEVMSERLPSREHARLLKMLRDWEAAEGHNYRPSGKADIFETHYEKGASPVITRRLDAPAPRSGEPQPAAPPEHRDSYFGDGMVLYLRVGSGQQMIRVVPRQDEMVIGRTSADTVMVPDVNLAPFQADTLGVSRLHAGLRRHGDTLVLTDLGSLNHTYVNGEQLHPHEVRVLHDGDEIRFGHLVARVYFRHE